VIIGWMDRMYLFMFYNFHVDGFLVGIISHSI